MTSTIAKAAFGALAVLALSSAARAADVDINAHAGEYGSNHRIVGDEDQESDDNDSWPRLGGFEERRLFRENGRFHGRSAREWPSAGPPVFPPAHWGRHEYEGLREDNCRLIVKRRVNRWGDLVIRRIRVCD